jgi:hypothetical protein
MVDELLSRDADCLATGVIYRMLDYWTRNGVVEPASIVNQRTRTRPGSGSRRRWPPVQVATVDVIANLAEGWGPVLRARPSCQRARGGDLVACGALWVLPTGELRLEPAAVAWYVDTATPRRVVCPMTEILTETQYRRLPREGRRDALFEALRHVERPSSSGGAVIKRGMPRRPFESPPSAPVGREQTRQPKQLRGAKTHLSPPPPPPRG